MTFPSGCHRESRKQWTSWDSFQTFKWTVWRTLKGGARSSLIELPAKEAFPESVNVGEQDAAAAVITRTARTVSPPHAKSRSLRRRPSARLPTSATMPRGRPRATREDRSPHRGGGARGEQRISTGTGPQTDQGRCCSVRWLPICWARLPATSWSPTPAHPADRRHRGARPGHRDRGRPGVAQVHTAQSGRDRDAADPADGAGRDGRGFACGCAFTPA